MADKPEIFFSYAWGDKKEKGKSREKIVNELYKSLQDDGHKVLMDKYDLGYKGMITQFMKDIGCGKLVVVAISDKYLKSAYCMFELVEMYRRSNSDIEEMKGKMFPIVLSDAKIYTPIEILDYIEYWKKQKEALEKRITDVGLEYASDVIDDFKVYKEITSNMGILTQLLKSMNTLNPQLLRAENFKEIKKAIEERIASIGHTKTVAPTATATAQSQAGTQPPKHLTARPFLSKVFLGREEALVALRKKLVEDNNLLLLVNGKGGVGKTSLAAHYYNRYEAEYHHLAWVLSEKSIANALLLLAPALGLQFVETMSTEERLEHLLTKMASLQKPCLLVVDNANELEDLQAHLVALGRCHNFHLLLTSRLTTVAEAESWPVDGLPEAEALQLFKKYYPQHDAAEDALFAAIHQAVDRNTLVVELLAKNLARLNGIQTHYTLSDLLADLQGRGLLALSQSKAIETGYGAKGLALRKADPQAIIAAMYDLGELPETEKKLLSNWAVLPAENIPFGTLQTLLPDFAPLEDTLNSLAAKGWIEQWGAAFKISPVIQEITRAKNPTLLEDCRDLIASLKHQLDYEPGTGHLLNSSYAEARLYARYAEILLKQLAAADNDLYILLDRLGRYHTTTGNLPLALQCYQAANQRILGLCQAHPDDTDYKRNLAVAYERLGETYTAMGELAKALGFYEDETKMLKELFDAHPENIGFKNGLAIAYEKLGETFTEMGELSKSLGFYELDANLSKELFEAYPDNVGFKNELAVAYSKLGETYTAMGELGKALGFYGDMAGLYKELFEAYPDNVGFKRGLAIAYEKLGNSYSDMDELAKALGFYEDEANLFKELFEAYLGNVSFTNGLAISYFKLGETHGAMGDTAKQNGYYQQAKALWQQLAKDFPDYVEFTKNLKWVNSKLAG